MPFRDGFISSTGYRDLTGSVYVLSTRTDVANVGQCSQLCTDYAMCAIFVYNSDEKSCKLIKSISQGTFNADTTSAGSSVMYYRVCID